jgi:hypothetical protein
MEKGHEIRCLECKKPYRSGSLTAVARELAVYKFDLVGVQGVRWDKGGHGKGKVLYFLWKTGANRELEQDFLYTTE